MLTVNWFRLICLSVGTAMAAIAVFYYLVEKNRRAKDHRIGYDWDSPRVTADGLFLCGEDPVDLHMLLEQLRTRVDEKLVETHIGDQRDVVDFENPTAIGVKAIDGVDYVQYLIADHLQYNVKIRGEGGIGLIVRPCSKEVVDAFLYVY